MIVDSILIRVHLHILYKNLVKKSNSQVKMTLILYRLIIVLPVFNINYTVILKQSRVREGISPHILFNNVFKCFFFIYCVDYFIILRFSVLPDWIISLLITAESTGLCVTLLLLAPVSDTKDVCWINFIECIEAVIYV